MKIPNLTRILKLRCMKMSIDKTRRKEFVFTESNDFTFISVQDIFCTSLLKVFHAILTTIFQTVWTLRPLCLAIKTFAKAFLCNNGPIFDNQCCIFFYQRIFSIITSHNISDVNFLIITYWWHCRFLQFSCSSYLSFLSKLTFYYGYIWWKILREVILRMDDVDDSLKKSAKDSITP